MVSLIILTVTRNCASVDKALTYLCSKFHPDSDRDEISTALAVLELPGNKYLYIQI